MTWVNRCAGQVGVLPADRFYGECRGYGCVGAVQKGFATASNTTAINTNAGNSLNQR